MIVVEYPLCKNHSRNEKNADKPNGPLVFENYSPEVDETYHFLLLLLHDPEGIET